jgi:hypothetical protein
MALFFLAGVTTAMLGENTARAQEATPSEAKSPPSIFALLYVVEKPRVADLDKYRRAEAASFRSLSVIYTALKEPKIADLKVIKAAAKPADWLREHIQTEFVDKDGRFRLSVSGASPEEQVMLINALAKAHLRLEEPHRKNLMESVKMYKESLPLSRARLKEKEAWLSKDELDKLPAQIRINPDDYIKSIKKEIEYMKASIKKTEKDIEDDEKNLKAMPWVRVVKWAEVPSSK